MVTHGRATRAIGLEDINMTIIAIEEHWNSVNIRDALDRLQGGARDERVTDECSRRWRPA